MLALTTDSSVAIRSSASSSRPIRTWPSSTRDRRRHGPDCADGAPRSRARSGRCCRWRQAMADDRRLQRHDAAAGAERLGHLWLDHERGRRCACANSSLARDDHALPPRRRRPGQHPDARRRRARRHRRRARRAAPRRRQRGCHHLGCWRPGSKRRGLGRRARRRGDRDRAGCAVRRRSVGHRAARANGVGFVGVPVERRATVVSIVTGSSRTMASDAGDQTWLARAAELSLPGTYDWLHLSAYPLLRNPDPGAVLPLVRAAARRAAPRISLDLSSAALLKQLRRRGLPRRVGPASTRSRLRERSRVGGVGLARQLAAVRTARQARRRRRGHPAGRGRHPPRRPPRRPGRQHRSRRRARGRLPRRRYRRARSPPRPAASHRSARSLARAREISAICCPWLLRP